MVTVTFSYHDKWFGEILEMHDTVVTVGITASPDAIVGRYRTYVKVVTGHSLIRSEKNPGTDLYLLFNAWCPGAAHRPLLEGLHHCLENSLTHTFVSTQMTWSFCQATQSEASTS